MPNAFSSNILDQHQIAGVRYRLLRDEHPATVGRNAEPKPGICFQRRYQLKLALGTPLEGRYGRMLSDLRTKWTDALGHQALVALREIKEHTDALEAVLSRDLPEFGYGVKPARLEQICSRLAPEELLVEIVAYNKRYGAFVLDRAGNLQCDYVRRHK